MAATHTGTSRIAVGRINSTWGLRGHVKVTPLTSNPDRIQPGQVLLVRGEPRKVVDVAYPRGYPCVVFEGYQNPNAAATLQGTLIEIEEHELPQLPEGEFYVHDLIGLDIISLEGDKFGELAEVVRTGANDVYVIRSNGKRDILIPAIPDVVIDIDLDAGTMQIELIPGLVNG